VINYGVFASWFPKKRIGLEAHYVWSDVSTPNITDMNIDFGQYWFGVGLNFRF